MESNITSIEHHNNMVHLNYKKMGDGPALIILHGLFGSLDNWATLGRSWADAYSVYLVDLRNHGKSPHTDTHTIPDMVADLVGFIQEHQIEKPVVMGHSMGGKVVMEMALEHSDLIGGLIIVDIGPHGYSRGHDDIFEGIHSLALEDVSTRQEIEEQLSESIRNRAVVLFISKNIDRTKSGFRWKINVDVLEKDYEHVIKPIEPGRTFDGRVLLLRGERSNYVEPQHHETLREFFPNVQIVTIEEASHWVHADKPEEVDQRVRDFMDEL